MNLVEAIKLTKTGASEKWLLRWERDGNTLESAFITMDGESRMSLRTKITVRVMRDYAELLLAGPKAEDQNLAASLDELSDAVVDLRRAVGYAAAKM